VQRGLFIAPSSCDLSGRVWMKATRNAEEVKEKQRGTELRLQTWAVCGRRSLYPIRSSGGAWALELRSPPMPRMQSLDAAD
jgi:hypothetical protein